MSRMIEWSMNTKGIITCCFHLMYYSIYQIHYLLHVYYKVSEDISSLMGFNVHVCVCNQLIFIFGNQC